MDPRTLAPAVVLVVVMPALASGAAGLPFAQPGAESPVTNTQQAPEAKTEGASSVNDEQGVFPDTPGGHCVGAFFEAFKSGDDELVWDFEKRCRADEGG